MNQLYLGFSRHIDLRRRRRFLYIHDEVPHIKGARVFDLSKHSLNPLQRALTHTKARELASALYSIYPQGENTLTVRDGRRALPQALMSARRLDMVEGGEEVDALIADVLFSPLVKRVLCSRTNFSFNTASVTLVRLNRAEIGAFDALVLGLVFINHFKGQLIVPDFGFYARDVHTSLIHEGRLIAGLNFLNEVSLPLRNALLAVKDPILSGATADDATLMARYHSHYLPGQDGFSTYVDAAMK